MEQEKKNSKPLNEKKIGEIFVARQPIFDRRQNIYAYELLFRSGFNNFYDSLDGDYASSKTITDSFMTMGLGTITGNKRAFINFTRNLLMQEAATLFPNEYLTVEILENIEPDPAILAVCRMLKSKDYQIALDDFVFSDLYEPLIELADIIKIDFTITKGDERLNVIKKIKAKHPNIKFLAEKVETKEEYQQAVDYGYEYFQGYFFSKPVIMKTKDIPAYKLNYLHVLYEVSKTEPDYGIIENIIKRDMALSYKLLRTINSAAFGITNKISSIRQALSFLGTQELRKWISLVALSSIGDDKPEELVLVSIIRAKFCELLADELKAHPRNSEFFLTGMLSLIDAFMDKPLEAVLAELPIIDEIKIALNGAQDNLYGKALALTVAYEKGDWQDLSNLGAELGLIDNRIPSIFLKSVEWANLIYNQR